MDNTVVDQTSEAESTATGVDGGGQQEVIDETASVQSQQQDNADQEQATDAQADGATEGELSPELQAKQKDLLRDYHGKTQKLAEDRRVLEAENGLYKKDAEYFRQLAKQQWFVDAVKRQRENESGKVREVNITDDEFAAATSDKRAMLTLMQKAFETWSESKFGNELSKLRQTSSELLADRQIAEIASQHPKFRETLKGGLLNEYLDKGYDYKSAYALYRLEKGQSTDQEVNRKAQEILERKKLGSVDRGGATQAKGVRLVEAKTFNDVFDRVVDLHSKGIKDFQVKKVK